MLKQTTLLITVLLVATSLEAATLSFSPSSQTVAVGANVTVDVTISGLAANQVIGGFDLTVLSDSTIVTNTAVTVLGALGNPTLELTGTSFGAGTATASEVSLETNADLASLQSTQPFAIFELSYTAIANGTSPLTFAITPRDVSDGNGNLIASTDLTFNTGSITVGSGTITPEPAPLTLAGLGLALGVLLRRKR